MNTMNISMTKLMGRILNRRVNVGTSVRIAFVEERVASVFVPTHFPSQASDGILQRIQLPTEIIKLAASERHEARTGGLFVRSRE